MVHPIHTELITIGTIGVVRQYKGGTSLGVCTDFVVRTRACKCFACSCSHVVNLIAVFHSIVSYEAEKAVAVGSLLCAVDSHIVYLVKA